MAGKENNQLRTTILQIVVVGAFVVMVIRLMFLQIFDTQYEGLAQDNYLRYTVKYPPRGEVFDRNGEYLVQSKECYDLMVIYRNMDKGGFDSLRMRNILGMNEKQFRQALANARMSPRTAQPIRRFLSAEDKLQIDEMATPGFFTTSRTMRQYPRKIGGNLLGSISEVSQKVIAKDDYYTKGDYYGSDGIEAAYEEVLRGQKGLILHDIYANNEAADSVISEPVKGKYIICTIDAKLQQLAEELLEGKVGAAVAIEPSTGEILVMASSPTFDPDEMVGRERGNNYMKELANPRHPLWNRAVKSKYPPGSTFKLVNGLIGLQEGTLKPNYTYPCNRGYSFGKIHVGCHSHPSPLNLDYAIATSCNAYFCYVFRNILENRKYGSQKRAFEVWRDYVTSFGFGNKLDSDFLAEGSGNVPDREFYDKRYRNSWNSLTVLSLSIGQGELGCTPMQLANLAATVANRGYYYIPHIVKKIEGCDSIADKFYKKNYTKVEQKYFDIVAHGMWRGVNVDGTGRMAKLEGYDVCGKTGTAQNPRGADHSTFISFAPLNNPKIAIAVYVEHGGFGASSALPIATLLEEQYLTDTIRRPDLVEYIKNKQLNYWNSYDRHRKK